MFERRGWMIIRIKGSHHIMGYADGRRAVIPVHTNKPLHIGILRSLLRDDLKLTEEEMADL